MAKKKAIVSVKRKAYLKTNHATINPEQLKASERNIYNKRKAGLARQSNAIKDNTGKFASKFYINEISRNLLATKQVNTTKIFSDDNKKFDELRKAAGVTDAELKDFYTKNKEIFEDMLKESQLTTASKNSNQLEAMIDGFKQKIFIDSGNGNIKEVSNLEASKMLDEFKQYVTTNTNAQEIIIYPTLNFNGDIILQIPDIETLVKNLLKILDIEDLSELAEFKASEISEALKEALEEMYNEVKINLIIS